MAQIISYIAISLNGKIARLTGEVDWLDTIPNPNKVDYGYSEFIGEIDTTIQGRATYDQLLAWDIEFPYKGLDNYVMSTSKVGKDQNVTFINGEDVEVIEDIKLKAKKNIWLIGGGKINGWFLQKGLIDELRVFIMPIILPDGLDLFTGQINDFGLELINSKTYPSGVLELKYKLASWAN